MLNMALLVPKKSDPNCMNSISIMAEDKMPPRKKYSLRFASNAARVKHMKIAVEPRNATVTILTENTNKDQLILIQRCHSPLNIKSVTSYGI